MAFPYTLVPTSPASTDAPAASQVSGITQAFADILGLPQTPTAITAAASKVDSDGQWPLHVRLTNKTGVGVVAGDVVALDADANEAVDLANTASSKKPFVVARETIANNAEGLFGIAGVMPVNTTGTITRGN